MIAMFDRYLSDGEVAVNRNFGPPNSLPITLSTLALPEDETSVLYP